MVFQAQLPVRKVSELIPREVSVTVTSDPLIHNLQLDSRKIQPGDLFVAVKGFNSDGRLYIKEALDRGAVAVLAESGLSEKDRLAFSQQVPVIEIEQLSAQVGEVAANFFGSPSEHLRLIGVTGTNGKTSVCTLLAQALAFLGCPCGVIGTLGWGLWGEDMTSLPNTTPDPISLQRILFELKQRNARCVAMEVSAHGLAQRRVQGTAFEFAVLTNISRDHLDDFGTMEAYAAAKRQLFSWPSLKHIVLNLDDPYGRSLLAQLQGRDGHAAITRFGIDASLNLEVMAKDIDPVLEGTHFKLAHGAESIDIEMKLYGLFNVSNALAVSAVLIQLNYSLPQIKAALSRVEAPKGRLQYFKNSRSPTVVVDYAHTPDALEGLLKTLKGQCSSKLILVFGCGGDRDVSKRALMGSVAEQYADEIYLTNDNPRFEDPLKIARDTLSGMKQPSNVVQQLDRAKAIQSAVMAADTNSFVVVAGKGHESYQEIMGKRQAFNDIDQVNLALQQLETGSRGDH